MGFIVDKGRWDEEVGEKETEREKRGHRKKNGERKRNRGWLIFLLPTQKATTKLVHFLINNTAQEKL